MKSAVIYCKESCEYIVAGEGNGDNLLFEDKEAGWVDYIMVNIYKADGCTFEEVDGAQILLDDYVEDMEQEEFIEKVLDFFGIKEDYIVLE